MTAPTCREVMGFNKFDNPISLEFEMEFADFIDADRKVREFFVIENDGSLRGHAAELVSRPTMTPGRMGEALVAVGNFFKQSKATPSERCSTHVHINVQEFTALQICTALCVYWYLEEAFLEYCDDDRRGNLFCLSVQDAGFFPDQISESVNRGQFWEEFRARIWNNQRYGALNLASIGKFGSLEFRALEGTTNLDKVDKWIKVCYDIIHGSKQFKSPAAFLDFAHGLDMKKVAHEVMGPNASILKYDKLDNNADILLHFAYDTPWANLEKEEKKAPKKKKTATTRNREGEVMWQNLEVHQNALNELRQRAGNPDWADQVMQVRVQAENEEAAAEIRGEEFDNIIFDDDIFGEV